MSYYSIDSLEEEENLLFMCPQHPVPITPIKLHQSQSKCPTQSMSDALTMPHTSSTYHYVNRDN